MIVRENRCPGAFPMLDVWINGDEFAYREWAEERGRDSEHPLGPPPPPTITLDRGDQNELVRQILTGPSGARGPMGVMGLIGPRGRDAGDPGP